MLLSRPNNPKYINHPRIAEEAEPDALSPNLSLRQRSLAQARESLAQVSPLRLGEGSKRGAVVLSRTLAQS